MTDIYRAAAYLRLSKDDGNTDESNSIQSQRKIINEFIKTKTGIVLVNERADDGYSGVNFERPAFKKMLRDIENGVINCVIVKDLSRLGRNYIEAGYYIERYFPSANVRFIAVTDCIDSLKNGYGDSLIIPFKNLLNDSYSADISAKIKASLDMKRKNGQFIGAFAPYGYKKDINNKNHLVKDKYSSFVVCEIFTLSFLGISCTRIAEKLNNTGVLPPKEYAREEFGFKIENTASKWSGAEVRAILKNEVYTGLLVQGRKSRPKKKKKKYSLKPEKMWFKSYDTHEAVINKSLFNVVNRTIKILARTALDRTEFYQFSGLLYCGICGNKMVHHNITSGGKKYEYCMCSGYKKGICPNKTADSKIITNAVRTVFNLYARIYLGDKRIKQVNRKLYELSSFLNTEQELSELNKKKQNIEDILSSIDFDCKQGIISKKDAEDINKFYLREKTKAEKRITGCLKDEKIYDLICQRTAAAEVINKIIIYNKNLIEIEMKFSF